MLCGKGSYLNHAVIKDDTGLYLTEFHRAQRRVYPSVASPPGIQHVNDRLHGVLGQKDLGSGLFGKAGVVQPQIKGRQTVGMVAVHMGDEQRADVSNVNISVS